MSNTANSSNNKDVIYIDVDDEITAIIDKVRSSGQRIVALVLPKRAATLQSVVNMKLLKRTAEGAKKHVVLITTEVGLLPLAGIAGLHVAKSLQSRPEIPEVPAGLHPDADDHEVAAMGAAATAAAGVDPPLDRAKPVGQYAGDKNDEESIQLDEDTPAPAVDAAAGRAAGKEKKDRKLKIPDFNKFRLLLVLGGVVLVLLIVTGYFALAVMPKAAITVKTNSSAIDTSMDVTLASDVTTPDLDEAILPGTQQKVQKTASQTVPATGSINKGEKASGVVTVTNCGGSAMSLPAGTGFSANGLTFISTKAALIPKSNYDFVNGGFKCKNDGKAPIDVVAQKAGGAYNLDARDYTIANSPENAKASGSAMAGGTDNLVKIVSQADVDNAKSKITTQDTDAIEFELQDALLDAGLYAVKDTFATTPNPEVTTSVAVGAESEDVAVTQKTTYTMMGVKQDDLKKLIAKQVNKKIDTDTQVILDYGLADAVFESLVTEEKSTRVSMRVTSVAGTELPVSEIKGKIAGKKANDAKEIIEAYPGVTEVNVKYSPFWVTSIPKKVSKITLTVEKPQKTKDADE